MSEIELYFQKPYGDVYPLVALESGEHSAMELPPDIGVVGLSFIHSECDRESDLDDYNEKCLQRSSSLIASVCEDG